MSAGFRFANEVFWGTNGAVEAYVDALATQAAARFGLKDPLAVFFREEHEHFFMGSVVLLDQCLEEFVNRERFLEILDAATDQLLREGAFGEYGREWVASVVASLRTKVAVVVNASVSSQ